MVLHGLYDTMLTQKMDLYALLVAFASFGWLAWQIEKTSRLDAEAAESHDANFSYASGM